MSKITPFLWFDDNADEALAFYADAFEDGKIISIARYPGGPKKGKVLTAVLELKGQRLMAIDGGSMYSFTEAISLFVDCDTQDEVDHLWAALTSDGGKALMCGWCTDRFGVTWQIIPSALPRLLTDPDPERARRATEAMLKMRKIDIHALERAAAGAL